MSSNVSNELKEFLLNICQLDKQIVTKICDKCSSLDQFWEKRKNWIDLFGLNGEMVKKIFKFLNVLKRAQADREEFEVLQQIDIKNSNDEEIFEEFYNQHKEKIKREINDITEEKIKEIYRFELNRYKQNNSKELVASASLSISLSTIGGLIGSFFLPGVGTIACAATGAAFGCLLGGLIGFFLSEKNKKKFEEYLSNIAKQTNEKVTLNLYLEALDALNVIASSTTEIIKNTRRTYLLSFHADKTGNQLDDNQIKKLMKLERSYEIIKKHRKQKNLW